VEHPDWYRSWRHEAVHQLQERNARLKSKFRLDDWPRFDYDVDAGTLIFSEHGAPKVIAEIQIVGSTSVKAGTLLWSWANSHWPADRVTDARVVQAFGVEHGICELTHDTVEDDNLNVLGWELTAVTARATNAIGAYRPPRDEGGGLYLTYKSMERASKAQAR
jgi:hypothetical protein